MLIEEVIYPLPSVIIIFQLCLKVDLAEEIRSLKAKQRSNKEKFVIYTKRLLLNIIIIGLLCAAGVAIYYAARETIDVRNTLYIIISLIIILMLAQYSEIDCILYIFSSIPTYNKILTLDKLFDVFLMAIFSCTSFTNKFVTVFISESNE